MNEPVTDVSTDCVALGFDGARLERVLAVITADVEARRCDGAEIIVARGGQVALHGRRGYADRAAARFLGADAVFASMSVGKQFTNVLALHYVERGDLRLHTPIADVLPAFAARGKRRATLMHLLTHTSGVPSAIPVIPVEDLIDVERLAAWAAAQAPESQPGERVTYSVLAAHSVIAAMLLRVAGRGRSFAAMLEEELFGPLGMRDTSLGPRADLLARLCPLTVCYEEPGLFDPVQVLGFGQLLRIPGAQVPAGGYLTTACDVHRFAEMLRRGGELDGARILSPAMIDFATRNRTGEKPNSLWDYTFDLRGWEPWPACLGAGFFLRGDAVTPGPFGALNSPRTFGGMGAGSTCFWIDPQRDLSFTFLSTGLMEDSRHIERLALLSDLVVAALT
ncbi:MAG: beta-lactamase family protein [Gammaproteobacteria bacterium]|nr:beta-lactamase family protein [Gammaproteobacteria bacterium]